MRGVEINLVQPPITFYNNIIDILKSYKTVLACIRMEPSELKLTSLTNCLYLSPSPKSYESLKIS